MAAMEDRMQERRYARMSTIYTSSVQLRLQRLSVLFANRIVCGW